MYERRCTHNLSKRNQCKVSTTHTETAEYRKPLVADLAEEEEASFKEAMVMVVVVEAVVGATNTLRQT